MNKPAMMIPIVIAIFLIIVLIAALSLQQQAVTIKPDEPLYQCAYEQDNNPPIPIESEAYYHIARQIQKNAPYLPIAHWQILEQNYLRSIELGNWKAMNNLALLYSKGAYSKEDLSNGNVMNNRQATGIAYNRANAIKLYAKMVELKVPLGYYNWYSATRNGGDPNSTEEQAKQALVEAARLGSPLAQVRFGNYYSFGLPIAQQRDDLAEPYFKCAGDQNNKEALIEVALFYKVAKKNKAKALYYFQKAASLGSSLGLLNLELAFDEDDAYKFGYKADKKLSKLYADMYNQLRNNRDLTFPNLLTDYPLPPHPIQGYDADNPDQRPY